MNPYYRHFALTPSMILTLVFPLTLTPNLSPSPNLSPNPNPNPSPNPSPKPSPNSKPYNEKLLLTFCVHDESNGRFNCTLCNFSGRGVWFLPLKQCCGNMIKDMQGNCYTFD